MSGVISIEELIALVLPPTTGAMIYYFGPKTIDVAICAVIWTLLWWFVLTAGLALERAA